MPGRPGRRIRIADKELLRQIFEELHEEHGEDDTKAARTLEIDRSRFSRLRRGEMPQSISYGLFERLLHTLSETQTERLQEALLEPQAAEAVLKYRRRLAERLAPYGLEWMANAAGIDQLDPKFRLLHRIHPKDAQRIFPVLGGGPISSRLVRTIQEMDEHSKYRKLLDDFNEWAKTRRSGGLIDARVFLALIRVYEPILRTEDGVDLSWRELHKAKRLERYLKRAFANEKLLLDRDSDLTRAQQAARRTDAEDLR